MGIFRDRPSPHVDNLNGGPPSRAGRYGEGYVLPLGGDTRFLADEGSYFNAHNATAGTGIATATAPTGDSDTAVFLVVANGAGDDRRVYLDYVNLLCTAAGTAGASLHFTHQIDNIDRYTSGGSVLTARNVNMDSSVASVANVRVGAVTAPAASGSARKLGHYQLKAAIPAVADIYGIRFGTNSAHIAIGTTAIVTTCPVVLGAGDSWVLTLYLPSQSAASSYEIDMGWFER